MVYSPKYYVAAGGLISNSPDALDQYQRCRHLLVQNSALGIGDGARWVLRLDLVIDERATQREW